MMKKERIILIRQNQPVEAMILPNGKIIYEVFGRPIIGEASAEELELGKKLKKKQVKDQMDYLLKLCLILHKQINTMAEESDSLTVKQAWHDWDVPFDCLSPAKKDILLKFVRPFVPAYMQRDLYKNAFTHGLVGEMIEIIKDIRYNDIIDKFRISDCLDKVHDLETNMTQLLFANKALAGISDIIIAKQSNAKKKSNKKEKPQQPPVQPKQGKSKGR